MTDWQKQFIARRQRAGMPEHKPWQLAVLTVLTLLMHNLPAAETSRVFELRLRDNKPVAAMTKGGTTTASTPGGAAVLGSKRVGALPPEQRSQALAPQQIVVIGLNSKGEEVWRRVQLDPRLVRAEGARLLPGAAPEQTEIYQNNVRFSVAAPDVPGIVLLRIYKPRWTGVVYELDLLAETSTTDVDPH